MKLIRHGTASVEPRSETGKLLFDPFVPLKHSRAPVRLADFDGFSDILITHGHPDHIARLPMIVERNPGVRIHCTGTPDRTLLQKGVPEKNLSRISFGGSHGHGRVPRPCVPWPPRRPSKDHPRADPGGAEIPGQRQPAVDRERKPALPVE